jgi:predicted glycosyltransferase
MKISIIVQFHNGIGHLARVSAIASELAKFADVTVFSGGRPVAFPLGKSVRLVQLPVLHWAAYSNAGLLPDDPLLTLEECQTERSKILVESFRHDAPNIIITEFFPFTPDFYGTTLDGLLSEIRRTRPRPLLFCSIRAFPRVTFLDANLSPVSIRQRLVENYDGVLHHVDPEVFPMASLGEFLNAALRDVPVYQTGFVRKPYGKPPSGAGQGILLTVGGGNPRSAVLLKKWIESVRLLPKSLYPVHAVCGPLMQPDDRQQLYQLAVDGVVLHDSLPNLDVLMRDCRAVVCMGGYNTLIEALSLHKPILSFASGTFEDQHFQIERYAELGMLKKGDANWSHAEIAEAISGLINFSPSVKISANGAAETARILKQIAFA